jgi:hypothetical protein
MKHSLTPDLSRIFLVFVLVSLVCGSANAQLRPDPRTKTPVYEPGIKNIIPKLKTAKTGVTETDPLPGYHWMGHDANFPWAEGKVGLKVNPAGKITGDVLVIGLTDKNEAKTLTDQQKQAVESYFRDGVSDNWKMRSANVCGSEVQISPELNLIFAAEPGTILDGKNILYIAVGANNVAAKENEVALGMAFPDLVNGWSRFEGLRGTGTLPPFTIIMADPEIVKDLEYPVDPDPSIPPNTDGMFRWMSTATHEFGHALGLRDTYSHREGLPTNESPVGFMNSIKYSQYDIPKAYVAEVMTRVFECRLDITTTVKKTNVVRSVAALQKWDFLGELSIKHSNVLTSQWAYFNGVVNDLNLCTVPDLAPSALNTYQMCNADPKLNNANDIDFNLGPAKPFGDFLWEKESATVSELVQSSNVEQGKCNNPVAFLTGNGTYPLKYISPTFDLASDGTNMWALSANIVDISAYADAGDPDPERMPLCEYAFSWSGKKVKQSDKFPAAPIVVDSFITQDLSAKIGAYKIEVKMKLAAKSSGSPAKP